MNKTLKEDGFTCSTFPCSRGTHSKLSEASCHRTLFKCYWCVLHIRRWLVLWPHAHWIMMIVSDYIVILNIPAHLMCSARQLKPWEPCVVGKRRMKRNGKRSETTYHKNIYMKWVAASFTPFKCHFICTLQPVFIYLFIYFINTNWLPNLITVVYQILVIFHGGALKYSNFRLVKGPPCTWCTLLHWKMFLF